MTLPNEGRLSSTGPGDRGGPVGGAGRGWSGVAALTAVLVAAVVVAFLPAVDGGFPHPDDEMNFEANHGYRGLDSRHLAWCWRSTLLGVYQPLSWTIIAVEYQLWGMSPRGYHAASIALHAANVAVLYGLTLQILRRCSPGLPGEGGGAARALTALAVTAYAVHPLRAEVVAWASCQPYLPCSLLATLAVSAYLLAHPAGGEPRLGPLLASFLLFWAALLCKAPAVSLPMVLVVLDVYPLRRLGGGLRGWVGSQAQRVWAEKAPFLMLAVAFMYLAKRVRAADFGDTTPPEFLSALWRINHACYSVGFYVVKTLSPFDLCAHYEIPLDAEATSPVLLASAGVVSVVTAALILGRRRYPGLLAAWAAYLALLAPVSGLIPFAGKYIAADRYSYLPAMALVPPLASWLTQVSRRGRPWATALGAAGLAVVAGLVPLTRDQCRSWRDTESLWRHALDHGAERSWMVHNNYAVTLADKGRSREALAHYQEAIRINPKYTLARHNYIRALANSGKVDEAAAMLRKMARDSPDDFDLQVLFVQFLANYERYDEAGSECRRLIRLRPGSAVTRLQWGAVLAKQGKTDDAIAEFAEAVRLRPDIPETHYELATALAKRGRLAEAARLFSEAIRLRPGYATAVSGLGHIMSLTRSAEADTPPRPSRGEGDASPRAGSSGRSTERASGQRP